MKTQSLCFIFLIILAAVFACNINTSENPNSQDTLEESPKTTYLAKGKSIAGQTFSALSANLQSALARGGVPEAIKYCNLAAMPLVDSLSQVHQAIIRRTSLKARNPKDKPNQLEEKILQQYESQAQKGESLAPIVETQNDNSIYFFAPININAFCLQCHGQVGKHLTVENYEVIKKFYPEDEAVGYKDGDFRGMWSIQFGAK